MQITTISHTKHSRLQSLLSMKLRHVCDITTIRSTSQKTTPTAKQPLFRAPRGKLMAFYSSLAVSHDAEVLSRTIEAKTQLSNSAILAAYKQIGAAHAEMHHR